MTGQQWSVFSLTEGEWVSEQATARENTKTLANGAVYDMDAKRIVANPGGGTTAITQANTSEMRQRWTEKKLAAQLAASEGIARTAGKADLEAWGDLAGKMWQRGMDTDDSRGVEAVRMLGQMTGYIVDSRHDSDSGGSGLQINVSETGLQRLIGLLEGRMDASSVADATVIDADGE